MQTELGGSKEAGRVCEAPHSSNFARAQECTDQRLPTTAGHEERERTASASLSLGVMPLADSSKCQNWPLHSGPMEPSGLKVCLCQGTRMGLISLAVYHPGQLVAEIWGDVYKRTSSDGTETEPPVPSSDALVKRVDFDSFVFVLKDKTCAASHGARGTLEEANCEARVLLCDGLPRAGLFAVREILPQHEIVYRCGDVRLPEPSDRDEERGGLSHSALRRVSDSAERSPRGS
uniref:Uncharacterized protein n=1 Tax=Chromera velia CCMP2878 TaxID=1169474 RepID=A0A0G4G4A4_9ALVE|eukprot:Cvel_20068.t1-p1 / transcript=Cvel_20068.t1 / gene=Cvel_20068 / organism=Chromera_velia_CCMP2878 / gene_product=hypothetical protein / transcript_product=hypothetical protein / location=Cvel_scaffold1775:28925-30899(-) / protein_length=232 / sequence_SO=supercontig / SO=protein_coding / is_pseudo=false